jgi:hypothetical protein
MKPAEREQERRQRRRKEDPRWIGGSAAEALAAHELVFAAERARHERRTVHLL